MKLILGNKNYSSWSMRLGVLADAFDLGLTTETIWLDEPDALEQKRARSPAGRVPILLDGDLTVWDSLAICEYLVEKFPERRLWPEDPADRALARCLTAEMHAGFLEMRSRLPQNLRIQKDPRPWPSAVTQEVQRATEIFAAARGPFLVGDFCIADAFYAPLVCRLETYQIPIPEEAGHYCATLLGHPSVARWIEAARQETRHMPIYD